MNRSSNASIIRRWASGDKRFPGKQNTRKIVGASTFVPDLKSVSVYQVESEHRCYQTVDVHAGLRIESRMSFDLQPVLKGELLELRPLRAEDYHDLYAVAADPLIWEQHPIRDRYKAEVFRAFFRESLESGGALIAIDSKDGQVIGSSRFYGYDTETSEIEIGWTFLARSYWGGAYNREMKRLMLQHAFQFVNSVIFLVGLQNLRSQRAVEKIGAVRVGSRPDAGGRDSLVYRITASTFPHSPLFR
jgi:N-acetyltransferase